MWDFFFNNVASNAGTIPVTVEIRILQLNTDFPVMLMAAMPEVSWGLIMDRQQMLM